MESGLIKYFEPYRPFEFYEAGALRKEIVEAAKSSGLQYMFTKAGFNAEPEALYADEHKRQQANRDVCPP